jgi:hexosaminidase
VSSLPRFEWRGVMLDVARHFFPPDDVKRFIDMIEPLQLNRLHLHLTDDQGWRLEIASWPKLTEVGGRTAVGGGLGGFYTQEDYRDLVAYGADRAITIVPEIDMPGHVNAALVAYPELAPAGVQAEPYRGIDVGFSSLDAANELTYRFVDDVLREVAALTRGQYIHIGGDEAAATRPDAYATFVTRALELVRVHGKQPVGWEEIAKVPLPPGAIVQHWKNEELARAAVSQGARVIMSPATRTYLDMKYDATTKLGLEWAGYVSVRDASNWDPATQVEGVAEGDVLGVEACLWSETLETLADVEFMAFPRLVGIAGIARGVVKRFPEAGPDE